MDSEATYIYINMIHYNIMYVLTHRSHTPQYSHDKTFKDGKDYYQLWVLLLMITLIRLIELISESE